MSSSHHHHRSAYDEWTPRVSRVAGGTCTLQYQGERLEVSDVGCVKLDFRRLPNERRDAQFVACTVSRLSPRDTMPPMHLISVTHEARAGPFIP
jgi:hypothetical protein